MKAASVCSSKMSIWTMFQSQLRGKAMEAILNNEWELVPGLLGSMEVFTRLLAEPKVIGVQRR